MAKKKAELSECQGYYDTYMAAATRAEERGLYAAAVEHAIAAWPFIDGMMQYERRFESAEFDSIPAIDLVLRYAPLLFKADSLAALSELLRTTKRIERLTSADMTDKLARARDRLWQNHRLFCFLEANPDVRQDTLRARIGGDQEYWRTTSEVWEKMGLLTRVPDSNSYRLTLVTRLGAMTWAKCPHCGHHDQAPKAILLEDVKCRHCHRVGSFVLLGSPLRQQGKVT